MYVSTGKAFLTILLLLLVVSSFMSSGLREGLDESPGIEREVGMNTAGVKNNSANITNLNAQVERLAPEKMLELERRIDKLEETVNALSADSAGDTNAFLETAAD